MTQPSIPGYRIVSSLSESNRAQVFLAEQQSLQRLVALKVLNGDISTNAAQRARVIEEGKAAARLTHPNLLSVFDIGEAGGRDYIATEYVSGGTLRDRLKQGPMSAERALVFARDLATGLKFLHSQGFLHRDIKPTNVFFREDGTALLGEAGMARAASAKTPENEQIAFGSPHYMSPERAQAMPSDGRSDQYSLGVVIWEALTGKPPFDADDPFQVAIKHITEPVPALPMNLAWLQPIMGRCLAKNPEQRFAQTGDLLNAIEALLQSRGLNALPKERFSAPTPVGLNRPEDVEITQPIPALRQPAPVPPKESEIAATAVMTKLDQSVLSAGAATAIVEPVRGTATRPMAPPIPAQTVVQQKLPSLDQTAVVEPVRPVAPAIPAQTVVQTRPNIPAETVAAPAFTPPSAATVAAPAFTPPSAATVAAPAFTPPAASAPAAFTPPSAGAPAFTPPGQASAPSFHHAAQRPKSSGAAGWLIWIGVLGLICAGGLAWWLLKGSAEQSQMETPTPGNQVGATAAPAKATTPTSTAPAAATTSETGDVEALAAKARTAFANGDYVIPADQSAAYYYQAILKIKPDDADATLGMQSTGDAVEQQIRQALSDGTQTTARAYLDAAWPFFSTRPSFIELKAQFDAG